MNEEKLFRGIEQPPTNEQKQEKELNPKEVEQLGEDIDVVLVGMKERTEEIKKILGDASSESIEQNAEMKQLKDELEYLEAEYKEMSEVLGDMSSMIDGELDGGLDVVVERELSKDVIEKNIREIENEIQRTKDENKKERLRGKIEELKKVLSKY